MSRQVLVTIRYIHARKLARGSYVASARHALSCDSWVRPGGTTFHFVNDGIESALRQARAVAGDRDIRIAGGADAIQQYLRAGLVDEFTLAISPVMFGGGPRLFAGIGRDVGVELVETIASPRVTHVRLTADKRGQHVETIDEAAPPDRI